MQGFGKDLDFGEVRLQERWLRIFALEIAREFGDVVDFNVVSYGPDVSKTAASPTVVIGVCVVDFVLCFCVDGEREEVLGEGELAIDLVLGETKVFDVEKSDVVYGVFELLCESLFSSAVVEIRKVECHEFGPGEGFFGFGWVGVGWEVIEIVLFWILKGPRSLWGRCHDGFGCRSRHCVWILVIKRRLMIEDNSST